MVPIGRTLVLNKTRKENIPIVMTYLIWPALFAPVIAPVIGGYITQFYNWRYIFYFVLFLSFFVLILSLKWLSNDEIILRRSDKIDSLSYIGWFLLVFSIFYFFALVTIGYIILSLFSIFILLLSIFLMRSYENKIFDSYLLSNYFFRINIIYGSFFRIAIYCFPVFLVLSLISVFNYTQLTSGICIVFIFIGNILAKPIAAKILTKNKNIKLYFFISSSFCFFSVLCFINKDIYNNYNIVYFLCFIHGVARSFQFLGYSSFSFYRLKKEKLYKANVLNNSVMQLNAMFGQSIPALLSVFIDFKSINFMYLDAFILVTCALLLIPLINSFFIKSEID
jgi:MFS family permease